MKWESMTEFIKEMAEYQIPHDILAWAQSLLPLVGGLLLAYHILMKLKAEDERVAAEHVKAIRNVLIGAMLVVAVNQVFAYIVNFTPLGSYATSKNPDTYRPCQGAGYKTGARC